MYKNPAIGVSLIIEKDGKILLIKRAKEPFKDMWELPGGFVDYGELVEHAAIREAKEETSLTVEPKTILGVYSDPNRDPRKHVISIVFIIGVVKGEVKLDYESKDWKWEELNEIEINNLALGHGKMLEDYIKWKENKGTYWSSK